MNHHTTSQSGFGSHTAVNRWFLTAATSAALFATLGCVDPELDLDQELARSEVVDSGAALELTGEHEAFREQCGYLPENGFVNPLSGWIGVDEANDKNDGDIYYNALDWSDPNPGWGPHHCGEDWNYESGGNTDLGKPVYATANGIVRTAENRGGGWGKVVMIEHCIPWAGHPNYERITSMYAHLGSYTVNVGDTVDRGEEIGTIGIGAGVAHLHFEMRWDHTLPAADHDGYSCPDEQSGTFDPTDFIDAHPPGWSG